MGAKRGFALPAVLITLVVVSAMVAEVIILETRTYNTTTAADTRLRERWLLNAALVRGVTALLSSDDPMMPLLRNGQPVSWEFGGEMIAIEMAAESGKVDLNAGDLDLLRPAIEHLLGPSDSAPVLAAIERSRQRGEVFTEPEQVLPVERRFGPEAAKLRSALTVLTGQRGIRPEAAPLALRTALGLEADGGSAGLAQTRSVAPLQSATGASERPIYKLSATLFQRHGNRRSEMTVMIDPAFGSFVIVSHRHDAPSP